MKNIQWILEMTDKELAGFLSSMYYRIRCCPEDDWEKADCLTRTCDECWLEWLRKEKKNGSIKTT